jgi:hypothetical protein
MRRSPAAPLAPGRPCRGRVPAARPPGAASPRPSTPPARRRRAPSRCARCSATRAGRTTRSGPRPPPTRSSRCARTPPGETTSHGEHLPLSAQFRDPGDRNSQVTALRPSRSCSSDKSQGHGSAGRCYPSLSSIKIADQDVEMHAGRESIAIPGSLEPEFYQFSCWAGGARAVVVESLPVAGACGWGWCGAMLAGPAAVDVGALWCGRARKLA